MIYLDYNSSAPCSPHVIAKVAAVLECVGNASSVHRCGQQMSTFLGEARARIADFLDIPKSNLIFTSGATESNHLILQGIQKDVALISSLSHPSAIEAVAGSSNPYHVLPVTQEGHMDLEVLQGYLTQYAHSSILLSLSYGEAETGILQPLEPLWDLIKSHDVFVHLDASQALGRVPLLLAEWGVDAASFSGHKVGAPQGVGAVYLKDPSRIKAFMGGGGQEWGIRSGTPNLSGIVGFAEALCCFSGSIWTEVAQKRNLMESKLFEWNPHLYIAGHASQRLPNTSLIATGSLSSHIQVIRLDGQDICVSSGSACAAKKQRALQSLTVMKVPELICNTAIRISLGPQTTWDELDRFIRSYQQIHEGLFKVS